MGGGSSGLGVASAAGGLIASCVCMGAELQRAAPAESPSQALARQRTHSTTSWRPACAPRVAYVTVNTRREHTDPGAYSDATQMDPSGAMARTLQPAITMAGPTRAAGALALLVALCILVPSWSAQLRGEGREPLLSDSDEEMQMEKKRKTCEPLEVRGVQAALPA